MAVVGNAYVRIRLIGDKVSKDINDALEKSLKNAGDRQAKETGKSVGDTIANNIEQSLSNNPKVRQAGENVVKTIEKTLTDNPKIRTVGDKVGSTLGDGVRRGIDGATPEVENGFQRLGPRISSTFNDIFDKLKSPFASKGGMLANIWGMSFGKTLKIDTLIIAGLSAPSVISGLGGIVGAYAATLVPLATGLGLGIGSAMSVGLAGAVSLLGGLKLVGLAIDSGTESAKAFQERMAAVKTQVGTAVAGGFFPAVKAATVGLKSDMTVLSGSLKNVGTGFGRLTSQIINTATSATNLERLQSILDKMGSSASAAGPGMSGITNAVIILLDASAPLIDYMVSLVNQFGAWASSSLEAAAASGTLQDRILSIVDRTKQMISILGNFGAGIANIFSASVPASSSLMDSIDKIGQKFRAWTEDTGNQQRMVDFFNKMRDVSREVNSLLGDLFGTVGSGLANMDTGPLMSFFDVLRQLGPSLASMFEAIQQNAGSAVFALFESLTKVITELANSGVIGTVANALAKIVEVFAFLLQLPIVGELAKLLAIFGGMAAAFALLSGPLKLILSGFNLLRGAVVAVASVLGWPITIIAALVGAIIYFWNTSETFRNIVVGAFEAVADAAKAVWEAIKTAFGAVVDFLSSTWDTVTTGVTDAWNAVYKAVSDAMTAVWDTITSVLSAIGDFFTSTWNAIYNAVVGPLNAIWNVVSAIWGGIWRVIQTITGVILGIIVYAFMGIYTTVSYYLNMVWEIITTIWNAISGTVMTVLNAIWTAITTVWNMIWTTITTIATSIWTTLTAIWTMIWDTITTILSSIWNTISTIWNAIWSTISTVGNAISNFFIGMWNAVSGAVSSAWNSIYSTVSSALGNVWSFIQDIGNKIGSFFAGVWNGIVDTAKGVFSGLSNIISSAFDKVVDVIKAPINGAISIINSVAIGGLNKLIDGANLIPGVDIPHIPKIPKLAKGAVVDQATLAIVGEAGRELVTPEKVLRQEFMAMLKMDREMNGDRTDPGGRGQNVVVNQYVTVATAPPMSRLADQAAERASLEMTGV